MNSRAIPEAARRIRVRGKVQGVYFRASTAERAIALALCGCAENLRDGSVLVLAAGSPEALAKLIAWLRVGPPMARVDAVEVEDIDPATQQWPAGFQQR
ncbi:MAG: acylphosphatase [Steroidobacteraceae bacterium]